MEIEIVDISKLKPAEYNPRKKLKPGDPEYDSLSKSIDEFGYVDIIVWNKRTGNVVGGNQRLDVLIAHGVTRVACSVVDLPLEAEKQLNIALNKISGEWDEEKLAAIFDELKAIDADLSVTGFDTSEINVILDKLKIAESDDFDFDAAVETAEQPITQFGDVWELDAHRLICGDSTDPQIFKKLMQGEKADMLLTDPPYNVDYCQTVSGKKIENDNLSNADFLDLLKSAFTQADEYLKPGGAFYIWHADSSRPAFQLACDVVNWKVRQCLIWHKNNVVLGRQDYLWKHEPCLYGWKDGAAHYFIDLRTEKTVFGDDMPNIDRMNKQQLKDMVRQLMGSRDETTVINIDKPLVSKEHPTMKPVALFGRLIRNSSRPGETVLDMFAGSGTTMIAAEQLGRASRLIELDPLYCDVIVRRYKKYKPNSVIKLNGTIYEI